jgi:hypothetical protein
MTPEQIEIMERLKRLLKGECSGNENTCPKEIDMFLYFSHENWSCDDCDYYFGFINGTERWKKATYSTRYDCPCFMSQSGYTNGQELLVLIDDYISEKYEVKYE